MSISLWHDGDDAGRKWRIYWLDGLSNLAHTARPPRGSAESGQRIKPARCHPGSSNSSGGNCVAGRDCCRDPKSKRRWVGKRAPGVRKSKSRWVEKRVGRTRTSAVSYCKRGEQSDGLCPVLDCCSQIALGCGKISPFGNESIALVVAFTGIG